VERLRAKGRRAERKGQKHGQARKKGKNQRIQDTEEIPEYLERECKRKRNGGEIQM
jgi:hypothetical protein